MLFRSFRTISSSLHRSMPSKILVTRPLPPAGDIVLQRASQAGQVELITRAEDSTAPREWVLEQLRKGDVDGVVCMLGDKIDEEVLEAAGPSLKVISTMSAGFDHVDTAALKARGIALGTTPDALTDATADVGAMLVLMASRRAGEGIRAVADGKWPSMPWAPLLLCGHALQNSTVGILGFGKIGQLTLKRLLGFGIGRALYTTSKPGQALSPSKDYFNLLSSSSSPGGIPIEPAQSLSHLAAESDFLIITCALTPSTTNLINADFLAQMKPTAYIINTARGPVVDSLALASAVKEGKLAGAGLDVVTGEPNITADHPLVKEHRITLLPHIGSATLETRGEMAREAAVNVLAGLGLGEQWVNEVKL
ncbi:hypothetical protein BCR35DRAFT_304091 [Leucosporidium creatinivorum]|uniref:Glyoxylate reductase n=1 Tax=Leucosporidium creatinivorum TaxID=106004 RepID=A0A1Y2FBE9_9BASI|nr:hypothetical protein BCR35DRAFT_304091 [Leucosporidium creatinivorum]